MRPAQAKILEYENGRLAISTIPKSNDINKQGFLDMCLRTILILSITIFLIGCVPTTEEDAPTAVSQAEPIVSPMSTETAVPPNPTPRSSPTPTEEPTATPTASPLPSNTPKPTPAVFTLTGPDFTYENIHFTLDPAIATQLYPEISDDGEYSYFFFAENGHCLIEGCIMFTRINLEKEWQAEIVPNVETAVSSQDPTYKFRSRGAALIMQTHTLYLATPQLAGIRAVTYHTQNLPFISNESIKYEYRGITPDSAYYVQVWIPVRLPFLPDSSDPSQETQPHFAIPMPESLPGTMEELAPILQEYNDQVTAVVQETAVDVFTPNLTIIDQFISSITIEK
ncbi:MAG: hypothetical protein GY805_33645 [Chloroflexi bacterium]|nr:hypothetical protein [Chloroflexota bacterium]